MKLTFGIVLFLTCSPLFAGIGTSSGNDPSFWESAKVSVIIARISDIKKVADPGDPAWSNNHYHATLTLKSTLAGVIDSSVTPTLQLDFYATGYGTSIETLPKDGDLVVAVTLSFADPVIITANRISFMPDNAGMIVVKNMDDPQIDQILKKIQYERAHPVREVIESTTRPSTTQPSTRGRVRADK